MNVFSYVFAEWREFGASRRPLATALLAGLLSLCAAALWLGPALLSCALPLSALVLGWNSGSRYGGESRFRKLLLGSGLGPIGGASARGLEAVAEAFFNALVLAPPAVFALLLWQRNSEAQLALFLSFLVNFLLAAALAFPVSLLLRGPAFFPGFAVAVVGIPLTSLTPSLAPFSPILQAWAAFGAEAPHFGKTFLALALESSLALLLFAGGAPALAAAGRHDARH